MMAERAKTNEFVRLLAQRMKCDEQTAALWLKAMIETLYESFSAGRSVTLTGLGGFYVKPTRSTWVFKFNPSQRLRALLGWSSTYKGSL